MRAAVLGGGPGGLYFAISLKLRDPGARGRRDRAQPARRHVRLGRGAVRRDARQPRRQRSASAPSRSARSFAYWDDIAVHYRGTVVRSAGHGFCGIGRKRLLNILQERARALGVELRFETEFDDRRQPIEGLRPDRRAPTASIRGCAPRMPTSSSPTSTCAPANTSGSARTQKFDDAFTFIFEETRARLDLGARLPVRRRHRDLHRRMLGGDLAQVRLRHDEPASETIAACEKIFAKISRRPRADVERQASARLGLAQFQPRAVRALDARATSCCWATPPPPRISRSAPAPSSRMESAIALADYVHSEPDSAGRLPPLRGRAPAGSAAPAERRAQFDRMVRGRRALFRISIRCSSTIRCSRARSASATRTCAQRDPEWLAGAEKWFEQQRDRARRRTPRGRRCSCRSACASCDLQTASASRRWRNTARVDGTPNDWHFVHYAERAKGGAGLVFTEMTCVSPQGRISPGCTGLYSDEHERAWKRLVDFVHAETEAKIAIQLGHSGPKGSTQLGWETIRRAAARRTTGR